MRLTFPKAGNEISSAACPPGVPGYLPQRSALERPPPAPVADMGSCSHPFRTKQHLPIHIYCSVLVSEARRQPTAFRTGLVHFLRPAKFLRAARPRPRSVYSSPDILRLKASRPSRPRTSRTREAVRPHVFYAATPGIERAAADETAAPARPSAEPRQYGYRAQDDLLDSIAQVSRIRNRRSRSRAQRRSALRQSRQCARAVCALRGRCSARPARTSGSDNS